MIEVHKTAEYTAWYKDIADKTLRARIKDRTARLCYGNEGDHKSVGGGVWELRMPFGGGLRIYYARMGLHILLLLAGGDKSTQSRDIEKAKAILQREKEVGAWKQQNGTWTKS